VAPQPRPTPAEAGAQRIPNLLVLPNMPMRDQVYHTLNKFNEIGKKS
jgi:hypothetical protein